MDVRSAVADAVKASMKSGDSARTGTLRMIMARIKDVDIAARTKGPDPVPDDELHAALRSMVKSRHDSIALYVQGNRPELADKERAEIAVIEHFLPRQLDDDAMATAVDEAVASTGATSPKQMGQVMATLKAKYAASLDMSKVGPLVKARLGG